VETSAPGVAYSWNFGVGSKGTLLILLSLLIDGFRH
jgi:hypothetical protein